MLARIFRPARSASSSGKAKTHDWVLEFEPESARLPDPLMGWPQMTDPDGQIRLTFASQEDAVAYAEARGPVVEALEAGVNVVISTDGTAPAVVDAAWRIVDGQPGIVPR